MRWLLHVTGIDTQQSPYYDFWSGIATQASIIVAVAVSWRRHNCHHRWCPFVQFKPHPADPAHMVCRWHHRRAKGAV